MKIFIEAEYEGPLTEQQLKQLFEQWNNTNNVVYPTPFGTLFQTRVSVNEN